jgi:hypothetical protein
MNRTVRKLATAAAATLLVVSCLVAMPQTARATDYVPYDDQRDSNYLKVLYHFVYPVGKIAELTFFRPLHTIAGLTQPDPDMYDINDHVGSCITFRPERGCSRGK